jgi:hypothetical protein
MGPAAPNLLRDCERDDDGGALHQEEIDQISMGEVDER